LGYKHKNGQLLTAPLPSVKAHNLILDTALSVGFLGLLSYLTLLVFCIWQMIKSPLQGIEAVVIAYLVFTFTWFECAQFTHLAWWSLSFWGMNSKKEIYNIQVPLLNSNVSTAIDNTN